MSYKRTGLKSNSEDIKSDKYNPVSKQFVRNGEVVPPTTSVNFCHSETTKNVIDHDIPSSRPIQGTGGVSELAEPKLYSSLPLYQSGSVGKHSQKSSAKQPCRTIKLQTNTSQKPQHPKGLKKINIPFDEQIYKGLVDLQVSEEDIGIPGSLLIKPKEFLKIKEEEPVLSDYFKPTFNKEYIIKPNPPIFDIQKKCYFSGTSVLTATKRWEAGNINFKM